MAHRDIFTLVENPDAARASAEQLFRDVKKELSQVVPASAEILHVGATAIPGCLTKGDLDIVVRVDLVEFAEADFRIAEHFARNQESVRNVEFAAFEDKDRTPHLGIQLTAKGGAFDFFHCFSDALRKNPEIVQRYNDLKRTYRNHPMANYRAAKDAFIVDVLRTQTTLDPGCKPKLDLELKSFRG